MKLILTYEPVLGAFVVRVVTAQGEQLSALETADPVILLREVHTQLLRMRHLASGKVFGTK